MHVDRVAEVGTALERKVRTEAKTSVAGEFSFCLVLWEFVLFVTNATNIVDLSEHCGAPCHADSLSLCRLGLSLRRCACFCSMFLDLLLSS